MIHPRDCECDTYGCSLRRKGITLSMAASPTARSTRPWRDPAKVNRNSWERGIAGEKRADGSFMPYLNESGGRIHLKEYSEGRRTFESIRRDQISAPSNEKVS